MEAFIQKPLVSSVLNRKCVERVFAALLVKYGFGRNRK